MLVIDISERRKLHIMNATNATAALQPFASILGHSGYFSLFCLSLVVICPVQLCLNCLVIAALTVNPVFKKMPSQRSVLATIAIVGLLTALALMFFSIAGLLLLSGHTTVGSGLCRFAQSIFHTAISMRNLTWATLSVSIFVVISYGVKKVKTIPVLLALAIMWIVSFTSAIPYFTPAYDYGNLLDGVICLAELTPAAFIHLSICFFGMGFPSHAIVLIFVLTTIIYVKRNARVNAFALESAMVKFASLLLIINFVTFAANFFGIVPFVLRQSANLPLLVWFHLLSTYLLLSLPGILTPLLMVAAFRPMRETMKSILSCHFKQSNANAENDTEIF